MWDSMDEVAKDTDPQIGKIPPKFLSCLTKSKDPRNCPVLFFHNGEHFILVLFLLREPILVMPINFNEYSFQFMKHKFGGFISRVNHHTFCLLQKLFIKKIMKEVQEIYDDMEKRSKEMSTA